jgi:lysophospholipase L1-like esterase
VSGGVLAFGDSITNGGGELQWGVALQSWALWTARGLGIAYTPYAVDGAVVSDVVDHQIPRFERVNADPEERFTLGCLYIGTNDIRMPSWDPARFAAEYDAALGFLAARCERTLTATLPLTLGRPPDPERIAGANAIIENVARRHGTLVLDLRGFRARNLMMADHVHPTALGQVAIAQRALAVLAADGMTVRIDPRELIAYSISRRQRRGADWTYTYRCAKARARQISPEIRAALRRAPTPR